MFSLNIYKDTSQVSSISSWKFCLKLEVEIYTDGLPVGYTTNLLCQMCSLERVKVCSCTYFLFTRNYGWLYIYIIYIYNHIVNYWISFTKNILNKNYLFASFIIYASDEIIVMTRQSMLHNLTVISSFGLNPTALEGFGYICL